MNLRAAAFSASRWTTIAFLFRAILQFAQTMILARLLAPADFGLVAIAGAGYAVITLFADLGLSNALIHFPKPSALTLSTLYWLNLAFAILLMLAFTGLAMPFVHLYHHAELLPLMTAMSFVLPLGALGQQFRVLSQKDLRFDLLALNEMAASLCGFLAALVTALLGGGAYSLVVAMIASSGISSVLALCLLSRGVRPEFSFSFESARPYLRYGIYQIGDSLLTTLRMQADLLIGGLVAGPTAMGVYSTPRELSLKLANTLVNPIVTRIGLPIMAKIQHDRVALKRVYLRTLRLTASINYPIYTALAIWSHDAVSVLLGPKWHGASPYLRIFAIWGLLRSSGNIAGSLIYATGMVRRAFFWNLALLAIVPCILWACTADGGTRELALTMLTLQVLIFYPSYRILVRPACGASFHEYLGQLGPPMAASIIAGVVSALTSKLITEGFWLRISLSGCSGMITYITISRFINREWVDAMYELLIPKVDARK